MATNSFPDFDDLPKVEGQPQGCAWGVFDKDGKKDVFGTLNFLTPEIVAAASKEVKDGISISLNWPLNGIKIPFPNRKPPVHTPHRLRDIGIDYEGWDDELAINTQFSSQWDSLLHVTTDGLAYNGFQPTVEGLSVQSTAENPLPTIEHWHSRGALAGRGVLIDWKAYQEQTTGKPYHPLDGHRITVEDIEKVAAFQGVEFKPGDILIVRTGYTEVLEDPKPEDMAKFAKFGGGLVIPGVHGSEETARWLWNRRFAAVAGDAHAFEAVPGLKPDGTQLPLSELVLHPWLLTQFGMSIGELWDLKAVAAYAKKTGRYSFLLTSAPLNHPGLVASPPNAIALF